MNVTYNTDVLNVTDKTYVVPGESNVEDVTKCNKRTDETREHVKPM